MAVYNSDYTIFWNDSVWQKHTYWVEVRIVKANWGKGNPIDPKIPKYVVLLKDRRIDDDFYPICAGQQLELAKIQLDSESLTLLKEAWKLKETHNRQNLKNPEQDLGSKQLREVGV
jgi:hypothetical protein